MKKLWGSVAMIAATVLWGLAFSAQSSGMKFVEPMLFTAVRSVTGVFALVILIILLLGIAAGVIFYLIREKKRGEQKWKN